MADLFGQDDRRAARPSVRGGTATGVPTYWGTTTDGSTGTAPAQPSADVTFDPNQRSPNTGVNGGHPPGTPTGSSTAPAWSGNLGDVRGWVDANWQYLNPGNTMNASNTPGAQSKDYLTQRIIDNGGLAGAYGPDYWLRRMKMSDAEYNAALGAGSIMDPQSQSMALPAWASILGQLSPQTQPDMSWLQPLLQQMAQPSAPPAAQPIVVAPPAAPSATPAPTFGGGYVTPGYGNTGQATATTQLAQGLAAILQDPTNPLARLLLDQIGGRTR